jgi:hypothetical protein
MGASPGGTDVSPTPQSNPAAEREAANDRLAARIDPDVARLCTSADPDDAPIVVIPFSATGPLETVAGLRCVLGGSAAPDVVYFWRGAFETEPAHGGGTEDAFFFIAADRNVAPGDCATDTRAWGTWEFVGSGGKLLCSRFGGEALLLWTYDVDPIIGLAEREDGDSQRLYRWWLDHARVLAPEPSS